MKRPLIISDCDEVLLHMVSPFRDWLAETQGVEFRMEGNDFSRALRWQDSGEVLAPEEIWSKLGGFFDTEMHRQTPISGAIEGMAALREHADVVILTNLVDKRQQMRRAQLLDHGLDARVFTNQGPKGPALQAILENALDLDAGRYVRGGSSSRPSTPPDCFLSVLPAETLSRIFTCARCLFSCQNLVTASGTTRCT